jgi:hypothetical protein
LGAQPQSAGPSDFLILLTNVTNAILLSPALPDTLGKSELVFFYKDKGDPTDLKNFRGLALQSVIYKIAAAYTASKFTQAAEDLGLLAPEQVAVRQGGRASDHAAVTVAALADARREGRELHVMTCDIQKAFDEAPREGVQEAMHVHGFPAELVRRAAMLQTCTGAVVRTDYGRTAPVLTVKGCKQGCPLSPIAYCLFTNMLLKGLATCGHPGYALTAPSEARTLAYLLYQGCMDDLSLYAASVRVAQGLLAYAAAFLIAYGMRFNAGKCRHTHVNATPTAEGSPPQISLAQGSGGDGRIPQTGKGEYFEYLGHRISPTGDWSAQQQATSSKLSAAMGKVCRASANRVCTILYTAKLTEQHVVSKLPYLMAAVGFPSKWLDTCRTILARAVATRAGLGDDVARVNIFGAHERKGLGVTDPCALDAGVKASTMLRLLNTNAPAAVQPIAERAMAALQAVLATGARTTNIPATFVQGHKALGHRPEGEPSWSITENYVNLGRVPMACLCPQLTARAASQGLRRLGNLQASAALRLAVTAPSAALAARMPGHPGPILVSRAEEDILLTRGSALGSWLDGLEAALPRSPSPQLPAHDPVGRNDTATAAAAAGNALRALLTPQGLRAVTGLQLQGRISLAKTLIATLRTELTGPLNFRFVTGLTSLHHAAYHGAPVEPPPQGIAGNPGRSGRVP